MVDLEQVHAALFNLIKLAQLPPDLHWNTTSRWLTHWEDCPNASQPAMFLKAAQPEVKESTLGLPVWTIRAQIWIYFKTDASGDPTMYPSKSIFGYINAIVNMLAGVPPGSPQTLGGLVEHVKIEGAIGFDEGVPQSDTQAVIVIPLVISTGV